MRLFRDYIPNKYIAVSKIRDFGDDLIKKLLEKTTNNFWIHALKSWLYVLASYIGNLQNSDKVTLSPVWYTSKIKKGVKSGNDFLDDN